MPISLAITKRYKVNGSHHDDNPLIRPRGISIAANPSLGATNREHRKLIGVNTMSVSTNYSFYCCIWGAASIRNLDYKLQRRLFDVMPTQQSYDTRNFLAPRGLHEDKLCITLEAAMTPANVKQFIKHPYSISRASSIDSDWFLKAPH